MSAREIAEMLRNRGFRAEVDGEIVRVSLTSRRISTTEVIDALDIEDCFVIGDTKGVMVISEEK